MGNSSSLDVDYAKERGQIPLDAEQLSTVEIVILVFVVRYHAEKGYGPSVRECGDEADLYSTSTTHYHLRRLRRLGFVAWDEGRDRTLRPLVRAA